MRLLIVLTLVMPFLVACSQGSSDQPVSFKAKSPTPSHPVPPPPQNPPAPPTDYSKVTCGTVDECAKACDHSNPFLDETEIRPLICESISSSMCASLFKTNTEVEAPANAWCKSLKVTEVIELKSISSQSCSDLSGCVNYCSIKFQPQSIQAIERYHAARGSLNSGAFYKDLMANYLIEAKLEACLSAPANYVIPGLP